MSAVPELSPLFRATQQDAPPRSHVPVVALLLAAALLAHGLLLLNDGVFWDGTLIRDFQTNHNWRALHDMYFEYGTPQLYPFHWFMGHLSHAVFCYKFAGWVSIALWGLLTYAIGCETCLVSRRESVFLGLVSILYPAFQAAPDIIILPYLLCYALFLGGTLLALRAERARGWRQYRLWASAGTLFLLSFTINSLLVFYGGFLILWVICRQRRQGGTWQAGAGALARERWAFLVLPVLYWVALHVCCPPHGAVYASYNAFDFHPRKMARVMYHFLLESVVKQMLTSLRLALTNPQVWLLAILVAWRLPRQQGGFIGEHGAARSCLWFGGVLLFLGVFPYMVTAKDPTEHGWYSRNALLIALPMAIILLGIARLLRKTSGARFRVGVGLLTLLLCGFVLSLTASYVSWQARWVKTQAVLFHLRDMPSCRNYAVYVIEDDFALTEDDHRIFYDWASVFKQAWGGETRAGLDYKVYYSDMFLQPPMRVFYSDRFLLSHFDPNGPRATLTIRRVQACSDSDLCFHYLYYRLFQREQLADYLRQAASVECRRVR